MVRMPNREREEEGRRMNPDSSAGIYATASLESKCRLIAQKRNMKEEEKINDTRVNNLKRAARMNQRAKWLEKLVVNLPNDMMASEDNSNPLLQFLLSLSTDIIKESYQNLGGKMGKLPDLKKQTVAAAIVQKWVERIYVMVIDACVS